MLHEPNHHEDLTARFRAGCPEAAKALWRRHHETLIRLVDRKGGGAFDRADAEDIAQEAWMHAWRARTDFQVGCAFGPWIAKIAWNVMRTHLRRRHRSHSSEAVRQARAKWQGERPPAPDAQLELLETALAFDAALESLSELRRRALRRHIEGQGSTPEDELIAAGVLRKRLFDARRVIERELRRAGHL
jgi:RNA polymerase sigma-70 factor, ECF subfamily